MTTEKMRVSASSVISSVAEMRATARSWVVSRHPVRIRDTVYHPSMWRRAFIATAIAWAAALPLAAWIAARPDTSPLYALAFGVYAAGSIVCHQMPVNAIRALAGLPLGAAVAWVVMSAAQPEVN